MGLREKILDRSARIGVVGLGYVGLPLAVEFGKAGYTVFGIDVDKERVENVKARHSYIQDVSDADMGGLVAADVEGGATGPALTPGASAWKARASAAPQRTTSPTAATKPRVLIELPRPPVVPPRAPLP